MAGARMLICSSFFLALYTCGTGLRQKNNREKKVLSPADLVKREMYSRDLDEIIPYDTVMWMISRGDRENTRIS